MGMQLSGSLNLTGSFNMTGSLRISGSVDDIKYIDFDQIGNTSAVGRLGYDDGEGTLTIGLSGGNVDLPIGVINFETCFNQDSSSISKGQAVRVTGAQGNRVAVKKAHAIDDDGSAEILGLAAETIEVGVEGKIITSGPLKGVNTSTYVEGQKVYLSTTPGAITVEKPQAPVHMVWLGVIQRVHATIGIINIKVQNGYEIEELHDVRITTASLADKQLLARSGSVWANQTIDELGIATTASLNNYTGSNNYVLYRIMQTTSSLNTQTGSQDLVNLGISTFTGSIRSEIDLIEAYTASLKGAAIVSSSQQITNYYKFAETASANTFYGIQTISGSLRISSSLRTNIITGGLDVNGGITGSFKGNLVGVADYASTIVVVNTGTTTDTTLYPTFTTSPVLASYTSLYSHASSSFFYNGVTRRLHMEGLVISGSNNNVEISGSFNVSGSTNLTGSITINESRIDNGWTAYTPQWTAASVNPVINNGTIEGYYKVIGKTCFVRGNIAMGSTTTFGTGEWYVSMPFTASNADAILMSANLLDNGSGWYNAMVAGARAGFNHKAPIQYQTAGGTAGDINATAPFTWASTDRFMWNGSYEIA